MTDTPKASVSPMAMAIVESAARQFFERQYILEVEKTTQLQKRASELEQDVVRLAHMNETAGGAEETEESDNGE